MTGRCSNLSNPYPEVVVDMSSSTVQRRAARTILGTLLVYALLVATHLGEFWPFSIYPMFSQAGNDWSRAVVRVVPDDWDAEWDSTDDPERLPGYGFPLIEYGIDGIDLANYVSKTDTWTVERTQGLHTMFRNEVDDYTLLVVRADGHMTEQDSVIVTYTPYALLDENQSTLNPDLPTGNDSNR